MRVLLVDDYEPFRACVARYLRKRLGAEVVEAEDGLRALEHVRQSAFDVILLDIEMPVMDGPELFGHLSAEQAARTMVVTGGARGDNDAWLQRFDESRVLCKPFDLERLTRAIIALQPS